MDTIEALHAKLAPLFPGLLGMRLIEAGAERVVGTLPVRAELCTVGERLHGGAIMAFADTLGAVATFLNLPPGASTTTIESTTKFVGGVPQGTTIVGECTAFHRGRTTMVWQTLVKSDAGKLCAVVTQTQLVMTGH